MHGAKVYPQTCIMRKTIVCQARQHFNPPLFFSLGQLKKNNLCPSCLSATQSWSRNITRNRPKNGTRTSQVPHQHPSSLFGPPQCHPTVIAPRTAGDDGMENSTVPAKPSVGAGVRALHRTPPPRPVTASRPLCFPSQSNPRVKFSRAWSG